LGIADAHLTSGVQAEHLRSVWLHAGVNVRRLPMALVSTLREN